jgi:ribosomal protein S20
MSDIGDFMRKQEEEQRERSARMFMENARNAMRAVKISIEEGDTDEALRLIDEALGDEG